MIKIHFLIVKNSNEKSKPGWVKHRASCDTPVYPPPRHVRNVRKRHNSFVEEKNSFFTRSMIPTSTLLSHDDEITTSTRSNVTIYRALQQVHEFEPWNFNIFALRSLRCFSFAWDLIFRYTCYLFGDNRSSHLRSGHIRLAAKNTQRTQLHTSQNRHVCMLYIHQ